MTVDCIGLLHWCSWGDPLSHRCPSDRTSSFPRYTPKNGCDTIYPIMKRSLIRASTGRRAPIHEGYNNMGADCSRPAARMRRQRHDIPDHETLYHQGICRRAPVPEVYNNKSADCSPTGACVRRQRTLAYTTPEALRKFAAPSMSVDLMEQRRQHIGAFSCASDVHEHRYATPKRFSASSMLPANASENHGTAASLWLFRTPQRPR